MSDRRVGYGMTTSDRAEDVLTFWLDEVGPKGWYDPPEGLDDEVRERFEPLWQEGRDGALAGWLTDPRGVLAYAILLDQFPRNMFRGKAEAFSTDSIALAAVKTAVDKGWDMRVGEPERQFFYLPMMHSECLQNQERGVRLIKERMPRTGESNLLHARAHRDVIRRFGRFPHRNDELGRETTEAERAFLDEGGYGSVVRELQAA